MPRPWIGQNKGQIDSFLFSHNGKSAFDHHLKEQIAFYEW